MPYSEVSITGYNSNPPEDDGTEASSNEVSWAKHKTKIGDPLKTAIESTQTNITTIVGTLEGNLYAPSGTLMTFQQTTPPTGWTKATTHNDKALRVVSGTPSSGGTSAFSTVFGLQATDGTAISVAQMPSHSFAVTGPNIKVAGANSRYVPYRGSSGASDSDWFNESNVASGSNTSRLTGWDNSVGAGLITADDTTTETKGSGNAHTHPIELRVQYVDLIIASKD